MFVNLSSGGGYSSQRVLFVKTTTSKCGHIIYRLVGDRREAAAAAVKTAWKVRVICHNRSTEVSPAAPFSQAVGDVFGKAGAVMGVHLGPSYWTICREQPPETSPNSVLWSRSELQNQQQKAGLGFLLGFPERWGRGQACELLARNTKHSFVVYTLSSGSSTNGNCYSRVWFSFQFPHALKSKRFCWCPHWF